MSRIDPPTDELAEIEAALAEDEVFDHDHHDHHLDHPHEVHHLDIGVADAPPTWDDLVDAWELYEAPIVGSGVVGLVLGFLSVYVVLRRMVFVSAAVTQAAGFGVAAAFYVAARWGWAVDPVLGATALSLFAAVAVAPDPRRLGLTREMVLGLAFALFAGATILASARIPQEAHEVHGVLFGTAVVVSDEDLHRILGSGAVILALQLWWFRGFSFASFDPLAARVQGVPVRLLDLVLLLSIGLMVGQGARALGALPAFAMSVLPGVAAVQLARGPLIVTFAIAALLGALAGAGGYVVAFFLDLPVGATQTVVAGLIVAAATAVGAVIRTVTRWRSPH